MMMDASAWTGVFALAGVLLGGAATHVFNLRREREARRHQIGIDSRNLLRARREELYSLVSKWALGIVTNNLTFCSVMQGKLDFNDALDLTTKNIGNGIDFQRIILLIEAFCPECRSAYDDCINSRSEINNIFSEFRRQYDAEGPFKRYGQLDQYIQAGRNFEKNSENLKSIIVSEVRSLN